MPRQSPALKDTESQSCGSLRFPLSYAVLGFSVIGLCNVPCTDSPSVHLTARDHCYDPSANSRVPHTAGHLDT